MAQRILFQGDSITDSGRDRDSFYAVGYGFASFVKGTLGTDFPGQYEFVNRGIAGNRVTDLYARNEQDFIELQPAFDEACKTAPPAYWSYDGVHPTACGHELIKRLWMETFYKMV